MWCPCLPWALLLGLDLTSLDKCAEAFMVNPYSDYFRAKRHHGKNVGERISVLAAHMHAASNKLVHLAEFAFAQLYKGHNNYASLFGLTEE